MEGPPVYPGALFVFKPEPLPGKPTDSYLDPGILFPAMDRFHEAVDWVVEQVRITGKKPDEVFLDPALHKEVILDAGPYLVRGDRLDPLENEYVYIMGVKFAVSEAGLTSFTQRQ